MKKYILFAWLLFLTILGNAQNSRLIAEKSGKGAVLIHDVQPKEGLFSLSRDYGIKVAEIAAANGYDKDKALQIGQKVKIPLTAENLSSQKTKSPVYYSASDGETFTGISNRFNKVSIKDLKSWNKIDGDIVPKDKGIIIGYFTGAATVSSKKTEQKNEAATVTNTSTKSIGQATVTGTNINIRKGPAKDKEIVATAQQDDVIDILKKINNDWVSVRTKDGVEGYMAAQFLQTIEKKKEIKNTTAIKKAIISGTNINVRKGPSTNEEVVGTLQQDDVVDIIKEVNSEWASIRSKTGVEGFIASRFLLNIEARANVPAKPQNVVTSLKKVKAYGTNINIRKGPSTDQQVVAMAKIDEELSYIKKVNDEWAEVRNAEGTTGFVASRFLSFDGEPSIASVEAEQTAKAQADEAQKAADEAAENEKAIAAAKQQEDEKAAVLESEKITANSDAKTSTLDESGFFKSEFEKYKNPNLVSEHNMSSGIFKTDRGWSDGKYYLLMDNVAQGTIVKLINPDNNKFVYAKVLGKMKGIEYSDGFDIRISEAAAQQIKTDNLEKFNIKVAY